MIPVQLVSHFFSSPRREGVVLLVGLRRPGWAGRPSRIDRALGAKARVVPVDLRQLVRRRSDLRQRVLRAALKALAGPTRTAMQNCALLLLVDPRAAPRVRGRLDAGAIDFLEDRISTDEIWSDS
jgi:hypothetical protein